MGYNHSLLKQIMYILALHSETQCSGCTGTTPHCITLHEMHILHKPKRLARLKILELGLLYDGPS